MIPSRDVSMAAVKSAFLSRDISPCASCPADKMRALKMVLAQKRLAKAAFGEEFSLQDFSDREIPGNPINRVLILEPPISNASPSSPLKKSKSSQQPKKRLMWFRNHTQSVAQALAMYVKLGRHQDSAQKALLALQSSTVVQYSLSCFNVKVTSFAFFLGLQRFWYFFQAQDYDS